MAIASEDDSAQPPGDWAYDCEMVLVRVDASLHLNALGYYGLEGWRHAIWVWALAEWIVRLESLNETGHALGGLY